MTYVIAFLVVVGALALALVLGRLSRRWGPGGADRLPYRKKDYLLSVAERSFYETLMVAVAGRWVVFAKVRLLDLLWLPKGLGSSTRQSLRNRVQSKHADFVLCDPKTLGPVLVIELDDSSHDRRDRRERDVLVDRVLASAGLAILRVRAARGYARREVAASIERAIGGTAVAAVGQAAHPAEPLEQRTPPDSAG